MKKLSMVLIMLLTGSMLATMNGAGLPTRSQTDYLNSVKITFLSWISGSTKISYERALPKVRQSSEICASVIGAGYDKYHNDPLGFTVRYGHKFFFGNGITFFNYKNTVLIKHKGNTTVCS